MRYLENPKLETENRAVTGRDWKKREWEPVFNGCGCSSLSFQSVLKEDGGDGATVSVK